VRRKENVRRKEVEGRKADSEILRISSNEQVFAFCEYSKVMERERAQKTYSMKIHSMVFSILRNI
jgi:hypothetical protein